MSKKIDVETMQAIFVAGQSRSGTTLIQGQICNSDNTIESTAESSYFRYLVQAYADIQLGGYDLHAQDYFNTVEDRKKFHRQILNLYFEHIRNRFGSGIPVQKEPSMMAYFPEIADLLPNSVFIATIRDPRDILTSQIKRAQKSGVMKMNYNDWQSKQFARLERMLGNQEKLKGRLFYVRYESLCANPVQCLTELNNCLEEVGYKVNLDQKAHDTSWQSKRDETYESYSELDGKPVSTQSIGNYTEILQKNVLEAVEKLQPALKQLTGFEWFCAHDMDNIEKYPAVIPFI